MLLNELINYRHSLPGGRSVGPLFQRNRMKEFLQLYLLSFIYKHDPFRNLIFYGGTCLRHCFQLPRLSEDLDFEYLDGEFPFSSLQSSLQSYFAHDLGFPQLEIKQQKHRLYLKFPILKELGLAKPSESNLLHIKIEIQQTTRSPESYGLETHPIFAQQLTFFIRRYDRETLMASKINAVVERSWSRDVPGTTESISVKGRDYFDLIWYMQQRIVPRLSFTKFSTSSELWQHVRQKIDHVDIKSVELDLVNFIDDPSMARDFAQNLRPSFEALYQAYYQG